MQKLLIFLQAGMFFSLYGIRSVLILYLVNSLGMGLAAAYALSAVFNSLGELSGLAGAWIAERALGLKSAILIGSVIASLGYIALALGAPLLLGLTLSLVGYSLIVNNIAALFGHQLKESDREKKFTLFYMMQNLGALASTILCGLIAEQWGYRLAFGAASLGLSIAVSVALISKLLVERPKSIPWASLTLLPLGALTALFSAAILLPALPILIVALLLISLRHLMQKIPIQSLLTLLGLVILFYGAQDQLISSLLVFTQDQSERMIAGIQIPVSFIMAVNPLVILFLGPWIGKKKIGWGLPLFLASISFASIACLDHPPLLVVSFFVAIMSCAEIMIGPRLYADLSRLGKGSMTMALLPIGFSLAYLLGGGYAQIIVSWGYTAGYGIIALLLFLGALGCQYIKRLRTI